MRQPRSDGVERPPRPGPTLLGGVVRRAPRPPGRAGPLPLGRSEDREECGGLAPLQQVRCPVAAWELLPYGMAWSPEQGWRSRDHASLRRDQMTQNACVLEQACLADHGFACVGPRLSRTP